MDVEYAREFGYRLKLVGQARETDGKIEAGVFPALIHHTLLLARVGGAYNAIRVEGNAVGSLFLHGPGAGSRPTASAVLGDLLGLALGMEANNTGFGRNPLPPAPALPPEETVSPWYIRVMVRDAPGVLRDIAGGMARENVSIAQVIQKPEKPGGVPLIFMTHRTKARSIQAVVRHLGESGLILAPAVSYRVLDKNDANDEFTLSDGPLAP
jgi:homoserine dehydrogenase